MDKKARKKKGLPLKKDSAPTAVVGVGASAGGLEAIESFFEAMPVESGLAFIVIQHLSPDYKSLMVELLSRKTEIPVCRAEENMPVEADHIYLIPPKKNLTMFHGHLMLHDQKPSEGATLNLPIDIFFESLATDQAEKAVAVILSGTGSDGTRGIRNIKEAGGLVLTQEEESAQFGGMPRSAASTGLADFTLPPQEMPAQLLACLHHPYTARSLPADNDPEKETGLTRIFSLLREQTQVDFTFYKPSTIIRRIDRRIAVTQVDDLDAYIRYLEENRSEITTLYRELLIGVTSFLRDPEVMETLQSDALSPLLLKIDDREIRLWVAGCSTGEEAYTLAILARETMEQLGISRDVKIFATDIDRDAILTAGNGRFPESIAADLPTRLLSKYFYHRADGYQITRTVREMVVFAQHNLVKDPPFTRIDLVSCRNLLIYLQPNLQQTAMEMFSFSLNPNGILLLGTSETVGDMESDFEPLHRKGKIYRAKPGRRESKRLTLPASQKKPGRPLHAPIALSPARRSNERLLERLLETLADVCVPVTAIVNEQMEVLHTLGDTSSLFRLPAGRATFDISRMLDKELAIPVTSGIQKLFHSGEDVVYTNVRLRDTDSSRRLRLRICRLAGRRNEEMLAVLLVEEVERKPLEADGESSDYDLDKETQQRIQDLEQELQFSRENLQATIEELETSNEELQATNEELLASNEELQSTNEELQSTNEELYTVNAEYQTKITELTEAQNDVENLLNSSRIGTLILDEDLCIRHFSQEAAALFNVREGDIGRPVDHLAHRIKDFDPIAAAQTVQQKGFPLEQDVESVSGHWYLLRIMPYSIGPKIYSGVVITVVDITAARQKEQELKAYQAEDEKTLDGDF